MQFNVLFDKVGDFYAYRTKGNYQIVLSLFLALGEMLGFTWDQIEEAYMKKNAKNHRRQDSGVY
jgi:dimeric dUTPase (all-alpha-NTP-PPase superfamily)